MYNKNIIIMSKWDSEKENLKDLINKGISYEEIGRRYNCSGSNIKKVAKKLGLELPTRRVINETETFNRGTGKKRFCINCGKELLSSAKKYCSSKCQHDYEYKQWIEGWKNGINNAIKGNWGQISGHLRRYIFEKYNNKCCKCGWGETNPYTGTIPLEIDHIDGNYENNSEDNLQLLCPNCHSLTETYRGANRGKGRGITWLPIGSAKQ